MKYLPSKHDKFKNMQKLETYQLLNDIGCPVLDSVLIEGKDTLTDHVIEGIKCHLKSDYCTMRYQYISPSATPVRGGSRVKIAKEEINKSKVEGTLLWLLEPTDRLTNKYGLNMYFDRKMGKLTFECVGKGFDTSNINRGDMNPHQRIIFRLPSSEIGDSKKAKFVEFELGWNMEWWKFAKFDFMDEPVYEESKHTRLSNLKLLGYSSADERIFDISYRPLSVSIIEKLLCYAKALYECEQLAKQNEFVVNCSVMGDDRFVFWDIATPLGKVAVFGGNID